VGEVAVEAVVGMVFVVAVIELVIAVDVGANSDRLVVS